MTRWERAGALALATLGVAAGFKVGRMSGEGEGRARMVAEACAAGHAQRCADDAGEPAWRWNRPCAPHWRLEAAKAALMDAGLIVGNPENAERVELRRFGGQVVRLVSR